MIMGAGKTTVVGPVLAMLLANSNTLMMEVSKLLLCVIIYRNLHNLQVVPNPLLDFSAGVLRERFSAVIRKPVFTFTFDRYTEVRVVGCAVARDGVLVY